MGVENNRARETRVTKGEDGSEKENLTDTYNPVCKSTGKSDQRCWKVQTQAGTHQRVMVTVGGKKQPRGRERIWNRLSMGDEFYKRETTASTLGGTGVNKTNMAVLQRTRENLPVTRRSETRTEICPIRNRRGMVKSQKNGGGTPS